MKRLIALFVFVALAVAMAGAQWHKATLPPGPPGFDFRPDVADVQFLDQDNGWAVGRSRQIYKTTDGGKSWVPQPLPPVEPVSFFGVYFDTPEEGWLFGGGEYFPGPGIILHTTDGGLTWTRQSNPDTNNVLFAGARVGNEVWLVGGNNESDWKGLLLRSSDHGATWIKEDLSRFGGFFGITVVSHDNVWLTGFKGTIVQTIDSGRTFVDRSITDADAIFRRVYFGPNEGYAVGNASTAGTYTSKFYVTTDNGLNWTFRKSWYVEMQAMDMAVLNGVIYVAGGDSRSGMYDLGSILASTDGGLNWTEVARDTSRFSTFFGGIYQLDDSHAWVAGQNVFYYQPNASPVVSAISDTLVQAGSQVSIQVQASDLEGDTLAYSLLQAPEGLAIDSLSGVISGRPQSGGQVNVQVSDGIFGNDVQASFRLFLNFPPQFGGNKQDTLDVIADSLEVLPFTWGDPNPEDTLDVAGDYPPGMFLRPNSQPPVGSITAELEVKMPVGVYPVSLWVMDDKGGVDTFSFYVRATSPNDVREIPSGIPESYQLYQNYPNPFNPETNIRFQVPQGGRVTLAVYNVLGQQVAVLVDEKLAPGTYEADFFASNLPSGMYVYVIRAGDYTATKKMLLVK